GHLLRLRPPPGRGGLARKRLAVRHVAVQPGTGAEGAGAAHPSSHLDARGRAGSGLGAGHRADSLVTLAPAPPPPSEPGISLTPGTTERGPGALARWLSAPALSAPLVAALLLGLSAYFTALNADLPIVRNALLN